MVKRIESRACLLACALAVASAGGARADELRDPVERCVEDGEKRLERIRSEPTLDGRLRLAGEIKQLCEEAQAKKPSDVRSLVLLAKAALVSEPLHPDECRPGACEEALRLLTLARARDRERQEAPRIAFELAMVYSRMGKFAEAVTEYDEAMKYADLERPWNKWVDNFDEVLLWGNSAESLMALGHLEESAARYRRAVSSAQPGSLGWILAQWGLGVVLDRDGQTEVARRVIRQVLDLDPAMARLYSDSVFFEPPGDIWYYSALGHEVDGDLQRALDDYKKFLQLVPKSPFAARAAWHVQQLQKERRDPIITGRLSYATIEGEPDRWVTTVRQQFERHRRDLEACYDRTLRTASATTGWVRMVFTYTDQGADFDFQPRPGVLTESFARCAMFSIFGWRFEFTGTGHPQATVVIELGGRK